MANKGGRRSSGPDNSSLILGVLVGMVLGLLVAGGVAWHLANRPKAFTVKDKREAPHIANAPSSRGTQAPSNAQPASGVGPDGKRFTFYEILTSKGQQGSAGHDTGKGTKPAEAVTYFLQAGSFAKPTEADQLKAKLAMAGMEANVQQADVPGKGTYYRVRLGPYHSTDEMDKANARLKQNGISNAAKVRAGR